MKTNVFAGILAALCLCDCSSSSTTNTNSASAGGQYQGTYYGSYIVPIQGTYQATLALSQTGTSVTGTFATTSGRAATVVGAINGLQVALSFTFTDTCHGSGTTVASTSANFKTLTGTFTTTDCNGTYSGDYSLTKK